MLSGLLTKVTDRFTSSSIPSPAASSTQRSPASLTQLTSGSLLPPSLDLHYITPQICAMSCVTRPSSRPSSASSSSNPCDVLGKYINKHHRDSFLAVNISDDTADPICYHHLHHQIVEFGWDSPGSKSQTPSLEHLFQICYAIQSFT